MTHIRYRSWGSSPNQTVLQCCFLPLASTFFYFANLLHAQQYNITQRRRGRNPKSIIWPLFKVNIDSWRFVFSSRDYLKTCDVVFLVFTHSSEDPHSLVENTSFNCANFNNMSSYLVSLEPYLQTRPEDILWPIKCHELNILSRGLVDMRGILWSVLNGFKKK